MRGGDREGLPHADRARRGQGHAQFGRADAGAGRAAVVDCLLGTDGHTEVVEGVRVVQRVQREVGLGEAALVQQRPEDEDGLVAAVPGLAGIHARQIPGPGLVHPVRGFLLGKGSDAGVQIAGRRPGDGVLKGQGHLRARG